MNGTLNLTQLSKDVAKVLGIQQAEVRLVLAAGFEGLTEAVAERKAVTISNFGSFRADEAGAIDFRPGRELKNGLKVKRKKRISNSRHH